MISITKPICILAITLISLSASSSFAQDKPSSLDDALLDSLTDGLGLEDDLLTGKEKPTKTDPKENPEDKKDPAKPEDTSLLDEELNKLLTEGDGETPTKKEDPLVKIQELMKQVEDRLKEQDSSEKTQEKGEQVVVLLDEIIAKLQQQCSKCNKPGSSKPSSNPQKKDGADPKTAQNNNPAGQNNPNKPKNNSKKPADESEEGIRKRDEVDPEVQEKRVTEFVKAYWGHLPVREQEMLIQSFREKFHPKYEKLIRDYYSRLLNGPAERNE